MESSQHNNGAGRVEVTGDPTGFAWLREEANVLVLRGWWCTGCGDYVDNALLDDADRCPDCREEAATAAELDSAEIAR